MRDNRMAARTSLGNEVIVRNLQERAHRGGFVLLTIGPFTDIRHCGKDGRVRSEGKGIAACGSQIGQFVSDGLHLVAYLLDTENAPRDVRPETLAIPSQSQKAGQKSRP